MIYFLKFSEPLGNDRHRAQYYIGYCANDRLNERIKEHLTGQGAAITRAAVSRGLTVTLVATLPGDRALERKLKNRKCTSRIIAQINRGILPYN